MGLRNDWKEKSAVIWLLTDGIALVLWVLAVASFAHMIFWVRSESIWLKIGTGAMVLGSVARLTEEAVPGSYSPNTVWWQNAIWWAAVAMGICMLWYAEPIEIFQLAIFLAFVGSLSEAHYRGWLKIRRKMPAEDSEG